MNIKKQIRNLYIYEIISGFQIVDLVWVFFLLQRGFSLVEVGVAEGVFHAVSMCFEIPSGMVSDLMGRKKTLVAAGFLSSFSALCMIMTEFFPMILLAMGLNALSYNMVSGTREALTYDSLLEAGVAERYLNVSARQEAIYNGMNAATGLISVVTVSLGYHVAYIIAIFQGLLCAGTALRLREAAPPHSKPKKIVTLRTIGFELIRHFRESMRFLLVNRAIGRRMIVSGGITAGTYLVFMLMQQHLITIGLDKRIIGLPLFLMSLCSLSGAFLAERTHQVKSSALTLVGGIVAGATIMLSGSNILFFAIFFAGAAHCADELVAIRLESENQRESDSGIRATITSVGSMMYSVWMTVLSPLAGAVAKTFSVSAAFVGLGLLVIGLTCYIVLFKKTKHVLK